MLSHGVVIQSVMEEIENLRKTYVTQRSEWDKQAVSLAAATLAVLVAFEPKTGQLLAVKVLLAGAWLSLGIGIVSGMVALYHEVVASKRLHDAVVEHVIEALQENKLERLNDRLLVEPILWLRICRIAMMVSFAFSVVFLVGYAISRTLL